MQHRDERLEAVMNTNQWDTAKYVTAFLLSDWLYFSLHRIKAEGRLSQPTV